MSIEATTAPVAERHELTTTSHEPIVTRTTPYDELPELMTAPQVAAYTGLAKWTVYQLINRGEIPHHRIGGKLKLVPKSHFHASRATKAVAV